MPRLHSCGLPPPERRLPLRDGTLAGLISWAHEHVLRLDRHQLRGPRGHAGGAARLAALRQQGRRDVTVALHIHCWHSDETFSKFAFAAGNRIVGQRRNAARHRYGLRITTELTAFLVES
ncbi:MAG: DUF7164 domain-containing protein [Rhodoferax sp.]